MVKPIGVVRKVDQLGRVVLPKKLRKAMSIKTEDPIEIFVDGNSIVLKKYVPLCVFCADSRGISFFKGKSICRNCMKNIAGL